MKNLNWLIKLLFYKHTENNAKLPQDTIGIFYKVGFIDQLHANSCSSACESMLKHFFGKPFATMAKNPRGVLEGSSANEQIFHRQMVSPEKFKKL